MRLIGALIVLAALALLCAVGIGIQLHGRAETTDSLAYWQAQLAAGDARDPAGFESPAVRVRRLQAELDAVPERLFPLGVVFVLATGLVVLGGRALRRG
ncbi:MAG: hypothetical protein P1V36_17730 [Planctomycetota bacterium]|nr:hypothetical protein [Planctomycetota bacterium]